MKEDFFLFVLSRAMHTNTHTNTEREREREKKNLHSENKKFAMHLYLYNKRECQDANMCLQRTRKDYLRKAARATACIIGCKFFSLSFLEGKKKRKKKKNGIKSTEAELKGTVHK